MPGNPQGSTQLSACPHSTKAERQAEHFILISGIYFFFITVSELKRGKAFSVQEKLDILFKLMLVWKRVYRVNSIYLVIVMYESGVDLEINDG